MAKDFMHKQDHENSTKPRRDVKTSATENAQPASVHVQRALQDPRPIDSSADTLQAMQRTHGNQMIDRMVNGRSGGLQHPIQAKLTVTPADDQYEREADQTAEQVVKQMNAPATDSVQRMEEEEEMMMKRDSVQRQEMPEEEEMMMKRDSVQRMEEEEMMMKRDSVQRMEEEEMMMKRDSVQRMEEEEEMMMKRDTIQRENDPMGGATVNDTVESTIESKRGSGPTLDDSVREPMERSMGADFSDVRVHTDSDAHTLNESVQARAFTTGKDIFFKQGEYNPNNSAGQTLLAHELTHVVQQNADVRRRKDDES